jgi:hypothetical protein
MRERQRPPPIGEELGKPDHDAGQQRQLLPHILELLDHPRHDENHQRHDDEARDDGEDDRISERARHLGTHLRLALEQVGKPIQNPRQRAGTLAGRDHRPVERREARRLPGHRLGQPPALHNAGMDGEQDRAHPLLLRLPPDRAQRFLHRTDLHERRELAREQGQLLGAQLLAQQQAARQQGWRRRSRRPLHPHDIELARAQGGAGILHARGLDRSAPLSAGRVERQIVEIRHIRFRAAKS